MEVEFYRGRRASSQYLDDTHDILDRMGYVVALHARERERERERERKKESEQVRGKVNVWTFTRSSYSKLVEKALLPRNDHARLAVGFQ